MNATARAIFANYVADHPGKAAKSATVLLSSNLSEDRARGEALAARLREADRCAVCGKKLTNKASMEAGIGRECRAKGDAARRALTALRVAGFAVLDPDDIEEVGRP